MLKPGKLPPKLLKQLLDQINPTDPSVLLGPQIGEDASVLNTSQSKYLVVTTYICYRQNWMVCGKY